MTFNDLREKHGLPRIENGGVKSMGNVSDGHHTFNELYNHRAILFSIICNQNKKFAWKSLKHFDGTMYDDMFVVGIDTPKGSATYHYNVDPYWSMFDVTEFETAPEWDGHTPDDALERLLSFRPNWA